MRARTYLVNDGTEILMIDIVQGTAKHQVQPRIVSNWTMRSYEETRRNVAALLLSWRRRRGFTVTKIGER